MAVHIGKLHSTQDGTSVGSTLDDSRGQTQAQAPDNFFGFPLDAPGVQQLMDVYQTLLGGQVAAVDAFSGGDTGGNGGIGECIPPEFAGVFANPDGTLQAGITICAEDVEATSSGGGTSISTPVIPPVLEILAERRLRRGQTSQNLLAAAQQTVPPGAKVFPGFEEGGLADVLLGLITGKGVDAAKGIIPAGTRKVVRQHLPDEPSVESELPASLAAAQQILDAMRVV